MIILPAIDILNGRPVRLYQGDYGKVSQVAKDVCSTAKQFERDGASWLHMVDLDGAKCGKRINADVIVETAEMTSLSIEVGGGIRTMEDVRYYLDHGVQRVILGTAAVEDEMLLKEAVSQYGERIAVGIDAKDGMVKTAGWLHDSGLDAFAFAEKMRDLGVQTVIATDIAKDGTMTGPSFAMYEQLLKIEGLNIIASGGISYIEDVKRLDEMHLSGAIIGRSLYDGGINLVEALEVTR